MTVSTVMRIARMTDQRPSGWRGQFFLQYAISCLIGTALFTSLRTVLIHFDVRPPLSVVVALMPAYFVLGVIFFEVSGGTIGEVLEVAAYLLHVLYYGAFVFLLWRLLAASRIQKK